MNELQAPRDRTGPTITDQRGIVLPVIVFGLLVMSMMAIVMMLTSEDENRSSRAMRDGSAAFYAAEAGLNQVYANWDSAFQAQVDSIAAGDSLLLGWTALTGGSQYRTAVHRWHEGGQPIYELTVEGRGPGAMGGQKMLSYMLTEGAGGPGEHYKLGDCCDAAVTMRGGVNLDDDTSIDGRDSNPAGWDSTVCPNDFYDKPGLVMEDTTLLDAESSTVRNGVPPLAQWDWMTDATFEQLGDLTWEEIGAMATKSYVDRDVHGPRPSTTIDPVTGQVVCNYADPMNMGSPDPNHPCFDYWPIVLIRDEVHFDGTGYAQGIFVLDLTTANLGSEFDIENDMVFNGLVLGKGCVEVQDRARFSGALFVDGRYWGTEICNTDVAFDMHRDDATLKYSTCVIDRALKGTGLDAYAEAQVSGGSTGVSLLSSRGFGEWIR